MPSSCCQCISHLSHFSLPGVQLGRGLGKEGLHTDGAQSQQCLRNRQPCQLPHHVITTHQEEAQDVNDNWGNYFKYQLWGTGCDLSVWCGQCLYVCVYEQLNSKMLSCNIWNPHRRFDLEDAMCRVLTSTKCSYLYHINKVFLLVRCICKQILKNLFVFFIWQNKCWLFYTFFSRVWWIHRRNELFVKRYNHTFHRHNGKLNDVSYHNTEKLKTSFHSNWNRCLQKVNNSEH